MCEYTLSEKEAPYPRLQWDCGCGFQYVEMEGYKWGLDNERTNDLRLPKGNCMKCKEPITIKI